MTEEKSLFEHVFASLDKYNFATPADVIERANQIERGEVLQRSSLLRCDCENTFCQRSHEAGACQDEPTVKVSHGMICAACAEFMPAEAREM